MNNIDPQPRKRKNTHTSSPTSKSNRNSYLIIKSENSRTPNNKIRSRFYSEENNKTLVQIKKKKELTFSNSIEECSNDLKNNRKKKEKPKTLLTGNIIKNESLNTILLSNKSSEIEDANKIMTIITMDEIYKQIKRSIHQYDKKELLKEIHDLETNDICEAIDKLPIANNTSINNDNKLNCSNDKDNNSNKSNKTEYKNTKKIEKIYNTPFKTKLKIYDEKYRKLTRKILVFDSLNDEENEEIEINFFYIAPDSITVYLIDFTILTASLIQLLYLPIFLAYNLDFCRNIISVQQLMFYLIDLFYLLDLITGFFRAYYNLEDFLIKNTNKICKNYLKSWFFTDCIEATPVYIILNIMENECKINDIYSSRYYNKNINKFQYILLLIKTLKIFKVISINTVLKKIKSKLNNYDLFFNYKFLLFTIFAVFSSLNISSCLFIFFGRNSYPGWITECNMQNNSFGYIYATSLYYLTVSVTTVGYGDIIVTSTLERIYQIIILIIGTCAYSWSITYISNYIKKIQEKSMDLQKKLSILEDIKISTQNMSSELYDKIRRYLQYNRVEKKNNNQILINCLPYPLKNNLFIEMYKNIIQNFKFFKSFENSNFIVNVVTSFKPVLSLKNDILIQEGDFVDDIIFVKEGVLSLEICIDLDRAQESIEDYLNEKSFGKTAKPSSIKNSKKFETHLYSGKDSFNFNQLKSMETLSNFTERKEKNLINKKYLRVLDIRKNEYYGDILMFLNERAPLRVRVKSKKAELFYLNKTDAIEISTLYPNIWNRIIKKSLFNMKQIKNLVRKILIYFSKLNGIYLNEEICKDINSDSFTSKSNFNDNSKIIENTNNNFKSKNKENEVTNNINNSDSSVIYEEKNESIESSLTSSKINYEITERKKKDRPNSNDNKLNNNSNSFKNININIKNKENFQLKLGTNPDLIVKQNNIENSSYIEHKKSKKLTRPDNNSFSYYSESRNNYYSISNENEVNSETHTNEVLIDDKYLQSDLDIDKEKKVNKKLIMIYINNQDSLNSKNEKKYENACHSLNFYDKKTKNFENLSIVNTATATISSIYDNLNEITKFKFSKDINLRKKTIQFLMEESKQISSNYSVFVTNFSPKIKKNNSVLVQHNSNKYSDITSKHKIKLRNSSNEEGHSSIISLNKELFSDKNMIQMEKNSSKISRLKYRKQRSSDPNKRSFPKTNYNQFKNTIFHRSLRNVCSYKTEKIFGNTSKNGSIKKKSMKNLDCVPEDKELNFYGKMRTLRGNNTNNNIATINNNEILKSPTKKNYLDKISQNILENRQTLNNPQEFYMDFFTNIVQEKINKRKKFAKSKKDVNTKKNNEVNKVKIRSRKSIFDKND